MKRSPFKVKPDAKPMKRNSSLSPRSAVARKKRAAKPAEELKRKRATRAVGKAKRPSRKSLVKSLDKYVSLYIRARTPYCVQCGTTENLTNGHLFTRAFYSCRFDITEDGNCHTQCAKHNLVHEYTPYLYFKWYVDKFGQEKLDALHERFWQKRKMPDRELMERLEEVKAALAALQAGHSKFANSESPARGRIEEQEAA